MFDFTKQEYFECSHTALEGENKKDCTPCFNRKHADGGRGPYHCRLLDLKLEQDEDDGSFTTPKECPFNRTPKQITKALKGTGKIYVKIALKMKNSRYPLTIVWLVATPEKVKSEFDWWLNDFNEYEVDSVTCTDPVTGKVLHSGTK